jgi:hypothetical protein
MKTALGVLTAALLLGSTVAWASPYIGTGLDWGWPFIEAGWDSLGLTGWVKKYEPNLAHWWSFGVEGKTQLFFENFFIGGGPRFSAYLDDSWKLTSWHWGLAVVGSWYHKPLEVFFSIYAPIGVQTAEGLPVGPIAPTWPFGDFVRISFGFRYLLWCGGAGQSPCPNPSGQ